MTVLGAFQVPDYFPDHAIARQMFGHVLTGDDIEDGDVLIIDPLREHEEGDIAVVTYTTANGAFTEGIWHVRHYGNTLILEASNPSCRPIFVTPDRKPMFTGVAVGRMRHVHDGAYLVRRLKDPAG